NGNGMSDIWELKYNASGLASNADNDGDGMNNFAKSIAGVNPFDTSDAFRIATLSQAAGNAAVTWPTKLGKRYQVQSCTNVAQAVWVNESGLLAGGGTNLTFLVPAAGSKFFRVAVTDVDTDGDGVSDWDELQVGFDP